MKRFLTTAAIALSMTTVAQADNNTTIFAKGYWRVTHIARNPDGNPMCMMQSQISFANSTIGHVLIVWAKGKSAIYLAKTNWQFSPDMQVQFSVILDKNRREFFGASRKPANDKYSGIFALVSKDEAGNDWLDAFASSETMTVKFHNGNEPQWSFKMAGSRDASKAFQTCIKSLDENSVATSPVPQQVPSTSPVPDIPTSPVQTVPIKKPKGDSI